jgi:hypothetical protein
MIFSGMALFYNPAHARLVGPHNHKQIFADIIILCKPPAMPGRLEKAMHVPCVIRTAKSKVSIENSGNWRRRRVEKPENKSVKSITEASIEAQMEKLRVGQSTNQKYIEE